jgi:hypothetical protein
MERKVQAMTCHLDGVNVKSFSKKGRKKRHGLQLADIMQASGKRRKHLSCLVILPSIRIVHGNENEVSSTHRQHIRHCLMSARSKSRVKAVWEI